MYLARVVGSTVATQKDSNLEGAKLLLVQLVDPEGAESPDLHVAVDAVGAGVGSVVVVVIGSGARLTEQTHPMPVDAAIVAIVDTIEREGSRTYSAAGRLFGGRPMNFGRVVGRVVATRRAAGFTEPRLLLVQPLDENLETRGLPIVAADPLQNAGLNDTVYYVSGSDATGALDIRFQPVDAAVVGFVDTYSDAAPGPRGSRRLSAGSTVDGRDD